MADPVWTYEYDLTKTPEANNFTRVLQNSPSITVVNTGNPANRRVEIDSTNGDAVFITSTVPSLNSSLGMTLEAAVAIIGPGNAGVQIAFIDRVLQVLVYQSEVKITLPTDSDTHHHIVDTADNTTSILWRVTYDGTSIRVYRAGTLVFGPQTLETCTQDLPDIQWWVEEGAIASFRAVKFYTGGAVAP